MSVFKVDEIELVYKQANQRSILPKITKAEDAHDILYNQWNLNRIQLVEDFKILLLNRANCVLCICQISGGSPAAAIADPKMVFVAALKTNACSIILAHNHPSGNLLPSGADITLTRKFEDGGKILDINILDHLILTKKGFYSISGSARYDTVPLGRSNKYKNMPVLEL